MKERLYLLYLCALAIVVGCLTLYLYLCCW
mgnify:CR=1 FL=1